MGVVYKARQTTLGRIVALKMILAGQLASELDVRRFYNEAEAAGKLDHPGIVPVHAFGQHDGQHFFSMGYVAGPSLADCLTDGPLAPGRAAEIMIGISRAIAYAHARGVIHRDLKPANVLLEPDGSPRVTDFGLARRVEVDERLTTTGQILGTPGFMAPEQAAGRPAGGGQRVGRCLRPGGGTVRIGHRSASLPGRQSAGHDDPGPRGGSGAGATAQSQGRGGPGDDLSEVPREGPRASVSLGSGSRRGSDSLRRG